MKLVLDRPGDTGAANFTTFGGRGVADNRTSPRCFGYGTGVPAS